MEFGLSEQQEYLRETVTRLLGDHAGLDRARRFIDGGEQRAADLWQELTALGVPGLLIDEAHGGVGLSLLDAATVAQCLGAAIAPVPFVATAVLAPRALARAGSAAQRDEWLPQLAAGTKIVGAALTRLDPLAAHALIPRGMGYSAPTPVQQEVIPLVLISFTRSTAIPRQRHPYRR